MGSGFFTYDCVCCGRAVRGKCLCDDCRKNVLPAVNGESGKAAAFFYDAAPKETMLLAKFHEGEYCMDTLVDWLSLAYEHFAGIDFDFAVPVPIYGGGKNIVYRMAEEFCIRKDIPFRPRVLRKIRQTKKQHRISIEERVTNLVDAFEATGEVRGKTVLLIDDIITSGATAFECSKALIRNGAERVCVLTVLKSKYE